MRRKLGQKCPQVPYGSRQSLLANSPRPPHAKNGMTCERLTNGVVLLPVAPHSPIPNFAFT